MNVTLPGPTSLSKEENDGGSPDIAGEVELSIVMP